MGNKHYTILAIPQGKGSIREFRISSLFLSFISILVISAFVSIGYLSYTHVQTRDDLRKLDGLERLTSVQQDRLDFLASKVTDFERKMLHLSQFDRKIRVMTNLDKENHNGSQLLGIGGPVPGEERTATRAAQIESSLVDKIHDHMDELLDEAALQEDSFSELLSFLKEQKSILAATPSIWPVIGWTTSEFGYRVSPFTGKRELHRGIDIATELGTEVVAPASGVVSRVAEERCMGNMVEINHGNGLVTVYGHLLRKGDVKRGQTVTRGTVIGYVGNSGRSTGPHLHYGISKDGVYVDPRRYLF